MENFHNRLKQDPSSAGHYHPITRINRQFNHIFQQMGFEVADGPEIENEWYNFDALNIPADHPARDMWDTFWLKDPDRTASLLRTHTSPVQVRYMEEHEAPVRIIAPGKIFRNEATDATHEAQPFQIEGLVIDKGITLAHLRTVLTRAMKELFHSQLKFRFRPSYFPFTEPSVEMDLSCFACRGSGCGMCKRTGWIEMLGAGMVHPEVLNNVGLDPEKWQGFAFGAGTDRLAMFKYGLDDIRLLYNGDLRVVNQF